MLWSATRCRRREKPDLLGEFTRDAIDSVDKCAEAGSTACMPFLRRFDSFAWVALAGTLSCGSTSAGTTSGSATAAATATAKTSSDSAKPASSNGERPAGSTSGPAPSASATPPAVTREAVCERAVKLGNDNLAKCTTADKNAVAFLDFQKDNDRAKTDCDKIALSANTDFHADVADKCLTAASKTTGTMTFVRFAGIPECEGVVTGKTADGQPA